MPRPLLISAVLLFSILNFPFFILGAAPAPWWSSQWTHRQQVTAAGPAARLPFTESAATGRFIAQPGARELRHWSLTLEMTPPRDIAADPKVHYGFPRMIRAADGRLLMYYRVGHSHASDPSTIAQRTSRDEGATWSPERIIHADPDGFSAHNPVAGVARDGRIVFFTSSYDWKDKRKRPMYWSHSDDHGETWGPFTVFDPDPSRSTYYMTEVLSTVDGLYGMSAGFAPDARTQAHNLFWFSPGGRDWELRSFHTRPEENLGNEVALFETAPGNLTVLLRDRRNKTTWANRTTDAGRTWEPREDIGDQVELLQRPFVIRMTPEVLLLTGRDRKRRLVVAYLSRDNGETWAERHVIDSYAVDGAYTGGVRLNDSQALLVYYGDRPDTRGKPDIRQVTLTLHDRPTHLGFETAAGESTFLYTRPDSNKATEDRSHAWMLPPGGWQLATLDETKIPRGDLPLAPPPSWETEYRGTARPESPWMIIKNGSTRVAVDEPTGALRILDQGDTDNEFSYISREWELHPGRAAEITVRLRVLSCTAPGGVMLRLADGRHEEAFTFFPDRILANRAGLEAPLDLTSAFVRLEFFLSENGFSVNHGERILLDGAGKFTAPAYNGRRTIDFGSGSSTGKGEALWRSLHYRITPLEIEDF